MFLEVLLGYEYCLLKKQKKKASGPLQTLLCCLLEILTPTDQFWPIDPNGGDFTILVDPPTSCLVHSYLMVT